jgi:cytochrome c-type biogenesis protein CcmH
MAPKSVNNKWSWLVLVVAAVALLAFGSTRSSGPKTQADRIDAITKVLACPTCQGESVYVSRASAAESIRAEVARQISGGQRSDDEIIGYIEARFGSRVLLVPRSTGLDSLIWILPVFALICAVGTLGFAFRRWRVVGSDSVSDEDAQMVERALREEK